jgi:hypothetical protein
LTKPSATCTCSSVLLAGALAPTGDDKVTQQPMPYVSKMHVCSSPTSTGQEAAAQRKSDLLRLCCDRLYVLASLSNQAWLRYSLMKRTTYASCSESGSPAMLLAEWLWNADRDCCTNTRRKASTYKHTAVSQNKQHTQHLSSPVLNPELESCFHCAVVTVPYSKAGRCHCAAANQVAASLQLAGCACPLCNRSEAPLLLCTTN